MMSRLLASCVLLFVSVSAESKKLVIDRLEASINSDLVLLSDVLDFRRTTLLRAQLDPLFSDTPIAKKGVKASDAEIVDFLINDHIIRLRFPVDDPGVEQEINSIQANNSFTRDALISALKDQGFSFEEYFELIRTSISKRNLIDRDIRTKVYISDDDIKNYFYNEMSPESSRSYKIQIITVNSANYKTTGDASKVADRARSAIRSGEPFDEVARRYSDDPSSSSGGLLGVLSEKELSPTIARHVKKLKVGETSPLIGPTSGTYFIIRLADIESSSRGKLHKMREQIRNQLTVVEYQRQIDLWIKRERQNSVIHLAGNPAFKKKNVQ